MAQFDLLAALEGIISSVPKAVELYHELAPLLSPRADIPQEKIDVINELVPVAHAAVDATQGAISQIIEAHAATAPAPATA